MYTYTTYQVGNYHRQINRNKLRTRRNKVLRIVVVFSVMILFLSAGTIFNAYANNSTNINGTSHIVYVKNGDTLWSIAERNVPDNVKIRLYINEIKEINGIESSALREGQKLQMP